MLKRILNHFFIALGSCLATLLAIPFLHYLIVAPFSSRPIDFGAYYLNYLFFNLIFYLIFVIPIFLIIFSPLSAYLEKYEFYKKYKLVRFAGLFCIAATIVVSTLTYSSLYLYSFTFSSLDKTQWQGKILMSQFSESKEKQAFSKNLCSQLNAKWKPATDDFETVVKQVDSLGKETGALATEQPYIQRGYITYYFEPKDSNLEEAKVQLESSFKKHGIGPTFYWLNKEWYKENKSSYGKVLADTEGPYLRVRFETLFPILEEYISKKILHAPPNHILEAAQEAGLKFIKSERLDPISYTYSIGLNKGYYNVRFGLWGVRNKEDGKGFDRVILDKIQCSYPRYSFKGNSPGVPPSSKVAYPKFPIEIPSCFEYSAWLNCQQGQSKSKKCAQLIKTPAPVCKPPKVIFSPDEY